MVWDGMDQAAPVRTAPRQRTPYYCIISFAGPRTQRDVGWKGIKGQRKEGRLRRSKNPGQAKASQLASPAQPAQPCRSEGISIDRYGYVQRL